MPATSQDTFLASLAKITGTGNFHSEGVFPFFLPEISVEGVGELAFPIPAAQARELIAVAEAAPYGKGLETVRDDAVRKCWQIDAKQLDLSSIVWNAFVSVALEKVKEDLGIEDPISALPYKLLIYEKGGHFLPHRDTEKLEAMFGTLIIALPSAHEGGVLHVRHGGKEVVIDFSGKAHWRDFQFAALFADCEHEVKPLLSGHRCCLVYNLRLEKGDPAALHRPPDAQAKALLTPLRALAAERSGTLSAVLLEHSYTEANFSLRNLKGNDSSRSRALLAAAEEMGLVAHLGLVVCHQSGELEGGDSSYQSYHYRRYSDDDDEGDDDGEMGEIYEESLTVRDWRDARDEPARLGVYRLKKEDLIADEAIDASDPDEKESEGYTGNAGCTMDYWYRRAAVVWWRREDHERILCDHDLSGACRSLLTLSGKRGKEDLAAFQRLAKAVVDRFPEALPRENAFTRTGSPSEIFEDLNDEDLSEEGENAGELVLPSDLRENAFTLALASFANAGAADWLARMISRVPPSAFGLCGHSLWGNLFKAFGTASFEAVIQSLVDAGVDTHRAQLFRMLEALRGLPSEVEAARRLLSHLVRLAPKPPERSWDRRRDSNEPADPEEARALLLSSPLIVDPEQRARAIDFLLADRSLAYLRGILGPLLLAKPVVRASKVKGSVFPDVLAFALETLAGETARELKPYPDWARPFPTLEEKKAPGGWPTYGKTDPALTDELARFMADPAAKSHDFKRAQHERSRLEAFIKDHFLDLDHTTIRRGTPHTLQVTKNDASYRHALKLREADLLLLAQLRGLA